MVSIIIPITPNDKFIDKCIEHIKASTYKDYEILVVDENKERSIQRNMGVQRSSGEYLLILDSDMYIDKDLLRECMYLCDNIFDDVPGELVNDALYIPEHIIGKGFWIKVRNFERSFYDGTRVDAVRFISKSAWQDYDTELTGAEDWDHDRRIKGKKEITFCHLNHDEGAFSFKRYLTKKGYYAQWMEKYKTKRMHAGDRYLPELDPKYRYWGVFMEDGKWKEVVRHPILFLCVIFLKVLIGIKYLTVVKK